MQAGLAAEKARSVRVLDVGCGCGDQSVHIASLRKDTFSTATTAASQSGFSASVESSEPALRRQSNEDNSSKPLLDTYVGITLVPSQAQVAQQRMRLNQQQNNDGDRVSADIFCADGADPLSWT